MVTNAGYIKNDKPNKMKREQREKKQYSGKQWKRTDNKRQQTSE